MSKGTADRVNRTQRTDIDLTKPVDVGALSKTISEDSCWGRMWDMRNTFCQICADCELCGILYGERMADMEAAIQADNQTFLDRQDWAAIDETDLRIFLAAKERTSQDFFDYIKYKAQTSDDEAVVEYIKRFVANDKSISIKGGKVIIKK